MPHSPDAERALLGEIQPTSPEQRLLDFVESLILDVARTHAHITQNHVADWLASVILPRRRKVHR